MKANKHCRQRVVAPHLRWASAHGFTLRVVLATQAVSCRMILLHYSISRTCLPCGHPFVFLRLTFSPVIAVLAEETPVEDDWKHAVIPVVMIAVNYSMD